MDSLSAPLITQPHVHVCGTCYCNTCVSVGFLHEMCNGKKQIETYSAKKDRLTFSNTPSVHPPRPALDMLSLSANPLGYYNEPWLEITLGMGLWLPALRKTGRLRRSQLTPEQVQLLGSELSAKNHQEMFLLALLVEQRQQEVDIHNYDRDDAVMELTRDRRYLILKVRAAARDCHFFKFLLLVWVRVSQPLLSYRSNLCHPTFSIPSPPVIHKIFAKRFTRTGFTSDLRGAWTDRDTNDIFAHCSLIFYFLDFKFFNFVCLSELHPLIWFFFKNSFRKKKNIQKTTQNALAPSIFILLSIALKLGTPLLHTQAQNTLLQNF